MFDYILHCLKTTYKYFALPLNTSAVNHRGEAKRGQDQGANTEAFSGLSNFSQLSLQSQRASQAQAADDGPDDSDCIIEEEEEVEECSDSDEEKEKEKADLGKSSFSEDEDEEEQDDDLDVDIQTHDRQHLDSFTTEDEDIFPVDEISGEELLSDEEAPDLDTPGSLDEEEELAHVRLSPSSSKSRTENEVTKNKNQQQSPLAYEFTKQAFTKGKSHTVVCSLCKRDGHLKKDCPEDFKKVELDPLPSLTPDFLRVLNRVCEQCYSDFAPDDLENGVRELILQDLESFVRRQFAGARLQLFGSSKNGFGFRQSDLDICMVLEGKETMDNVGWREGKDMQHRSRRAASRTEVSVFGSRAMLRGRKPGRKTQDMLEGLCFSAGLGTPWDSPGPLAQVAGEREVWVSLLRLLPLQPNPG
ncbi:hypothetical protein ILYODFUR_032408 [Ilyodon furcidens]|uniref:CCHC-type domain-containing protein n=1 Tax=Ilyodon furcidens TaxID=33524 RepID=A0ABV0TQA5_9TELE